MYLLSFPSLQPQIQMLASLGRKKHEWKGILSLPCLFYFYCTRDFWILKEGYRSEEFNYNASAEDEHVPPLQGTQRVVNTKQAVPEAKHLSKPRVKLETQTLFLCLYRTSVKLNPNGNNNEKRFNTLLLLLYFCYLDSSWQGRWLTLLLLHHQKKNNMTAKILENPLNVKDENCSTRSDYIWVL